MKKFNKVVAPLLSFSVLIGGAVTAKSTHAETSEANYGVSASDPLAAKVGMDVLENGGNAVDAAIAVSYALGVVEPYGSGLGGGGGMLIAPAQEGTDASYIDYREVAPSSEKGSVSVPGFVKGMEVAHDKYGTKPMAELIEPSIKYAEEGFEVNDILHWRLKVSKDRMPVDDLPNFYPNDEAIEAGETLKQPELAETLTKIKDEGADAFYEGSIADEMEDHTAISKEDLKEYETVMKDPVVGKYQDKEILSAPSPFSGVALIQMLKMIEKEDIWALKNEDPAMFYEKMEQVKNVVYEERFVKMGDPKFHEQDSKKWVSDEYVEDLLKKMDDVKQNEDEVDEEEHESTTHFVVIDRDGTTVSSTNTLSNFFGTGKQVEGFFLNNNLDTFHSGKNAKEEGKRSRTFTAPTVIRDDGEWVTGIGSAGGTRVTQILAKVMAEHFEEDVSIGEAVESSRFVFDKGTMYVEEELDEETEEELRDDGQEVNVKKDEIYYGGVQALVKNHPNEIVGGAGDPRRKGVWRKSDQ
ncbi:gamma-glutamyltransferase family protein [Metabacillus iocasae]|uniref:Gamma-glutamyltranspeptidase/glutathione hydrolase n=1 Tax=Priestia iocasae TaxID=2291674 RepID=A0ABS2QUY2_9BACI|nr:gamma-glutamyltransferase [Metabacillus iocasae]MBM7703088.1 gamma-glutamyltranspeptidase/glutathione hydrolase [Metabacillus iocasae]